MKAQIDDTLGNYQSVSSDSSIQLISPVLNIVSNIQNKAFNKHISENNYTNYILDSSVDITMNSFLYGIQSRVLGKRLFITQNIFMVAIQSRPNISSFGCQTDSSEILISFSDEIINGMQTHSTVTCGIMQIDSSYFGSDPLINTNVITHGI